MSPPERETEAPFEEPWQAKAFALAVQLSAQGLFTWPEWTRTFVEIARQNAGAPDISEATLYWRNWVAALERLIIEKGHGAPERVEALATAWRDAFATTPHGKPVILPDEILVRLKP